MDDKSLLVGILFGALFALSVFGRWIYCKGIDRGIEIYREIEKKMREKMGR